MGRRSTHAFARRAVLLTAGLVLMTIATAPAVVPVPAGSLDTARAETVRISDGATARAPDRASVGGKITITGKGWTVPATTARSSGSVIAVKFDDGAVQATRPVTNPATGEPIVDPTVVAAVRAKAKGSFSLTVPIPDSAGWTAGTRHSVRLLSGKLLGDDATRSIALSFDLVAAESSAGPPAADPDDPASPTPAGSVSAEPSTSATTTPEKKADQSEKKAAESEKPTAEPTASGSPAASPSSAISSRQETTAAVPAPSARSGEAPTTSSGKADPGARRNGASSQGSSPSESVQARTPAETDSGRESACDAEPAVTIASGSTVRGVPAADFGETLTLTGSGFCHPSGGGSTIGVQIDDGQVSRTDSTVDGDRRIWQIIEADADGGFSAAVRVPEPHQTDPDFGDGLHRLRLVTGSLRAGDAVRSLRTGEFLVSAGNHAGVLPEPTSAPRPVNPEVALVGAKAGAVTAASSGEMVRIVVPALEPGDWVFAYAFGDRTIGADGRNGTDGRPTSWLQLDANRSVELDRADLAVPGAAVSRVSLQARDGTMMGWVPVTAASAGSAASTQPVAAEDPEPVAATPSRRPRPLVVIVGGSLLLIGLASLAVSRYRRRRMIHELNEW